jgi:Acyl-CoA dehydrogenase, C-terminal domain
LIDPFTDSDDRFLATSLQALRSDDDALLNLGWADLLPYLDHDLEARLAVFALFRAQGRQAVATGALATLMAHPYSSILDLDGTPVAATINLMSSRRGEQTVVIGRPEYGKVLIDRPGQGIGLVDVEAAQFQPIDMPGRLELYRVDIDLADWPNPNPDSQVAAARARSLFLGRIALACDMLGAAESALAIAVEYAGNREQFGQPIGRFQAVRHLLAAARVDCAAVQAVTEQAIDLDRHLPPSYDKIVKAVAGRNSRRVCERALQVLGGIGFTAEHPHHHFHSRVLSLDALLGTSTSLAHDLAVECRTSRTTGSLLTALAR